MKKRIRNVYKTMTATGLSFVTMSLLAGPSALGKSVINCQINTDEVLVLGAEHLSKTEKISTYLQWQEGQFSSGSSDRNSKDRYFSKNMADHDKAIEHHVGGDNICDVLRADARRICAEKGFDVEAQDFKLLETGIFVTRNRISASEPARLRPGTSFLYDIMESAKVGYSIVDTCQATTLSCHQPSLATSDRICSNIKNCFIDEVGKGVKPKKITPAYLAFARLHQCDAVADSLKKYSADLD